MPTKMDLSVDLTQNVVPISRAASSLAALIKRASATSRPIIITQKGYPEAAILPIEVFSALKALVAAASGAETPAPAEVVGEAPVEAAAPEVVETPAEAAPQPTTRRRRRTTAA